MAIASSRAEWIEARKALLEKEKAHLRAGDALAAERRALPKWVVEEDYLFEGKDGAVTLSALFEGRSQLIVQHFMLGPEAEAGCPFCSFWADGYDPMIVHLNHRDVSFVAVSRGPIEKLQAYQRRMGWGFTWVSSGANRFNYDFGVSATEDEIAAGTMTYNYREGPVRSSECHGTSLFEREPGGRILHTYSAFARGMDPFNAAYAYLDLTPKGRNEDELPFTMAWVKRHDEY